MIVTFPYSSIQLLECKNSGAPVLEKWTWPARFVSMSPTRMTLDQCEVRKAAMEEERLATKVNHAHAGQRLAAIY